MAMTNEYIISIAREAGFDVVGDLYGEDAMITKLTRLVELEREACARLCNESANEAPNSWQFRMGANHCADAIRARGK